MPHTWLELLIVDPSEIFLCLTMTVERKLCNQVAQSRLSQMFRADSVFSKCFQMTAPVSLLRPHPAFRLWIRLPEGLERFRLPHPHKDTPQPAPHGSISTRRRGGEFPFKVPYEPTLEPTTVMFPRGDGLCARRKKTSLEVRWYKYYLRFCIQGTGNEELMLGREKKKKENPRGSCRFAHKLTWYKLFWMSRTSFGNSCINSLEMSISSWMIARCRILKKRQRNKTFKFTTSHVKVSNNAGFRRHFQVGREKVSTSTKCCITIFLSTHLKREMFSGPYGKTDWLGCCAIRGRFSRASHSGTAGIKTRVLWMVLLSTRATKQKQKNSNLKACVGSCSKQMQAQSRKWNRALVLNLDRVRTTQPGPRQVVLFDLSRLTMQVFFFFRFHLCVWR